MFPYSDVDVELMTSHVGEEGRVSPEQLEGMLHNIRMRIRMANSTESTGGWKKTMGWDLDQLQQYVYDPNSIFAADQNKALATASPMYATALGGDLPGELAGKYTTEGKAAAKAKMDIDLYNNACS